MSSNVLFARGRGEIVLTSEELAKIVGDAVAHAISAYELARSQTPEPVRGSPIRLVPNMSRLQNEMGLNDIEFEESPQAPRSSSATRVSNALSAEMGIDGFDFEDVPAPSVTGVEMPVDQKAAAALSEWDAALKRLSEESDGQ